MAKMAKVGKKRGRTSSTLQASPATSRFSRRSSIASSRRSSMSSSRRSSIGSTAVTGKSIAKRKKSGITSKFARKVQRIIQRDHNLGRFYKRAVGEIYNEYTGHDQSYYAIQGLKNGSNAAPADSFSYGFTPFAPKKVIDAASVMFNQKTKAYDGPITFAAATPGPLDFRATNIDLNYASFTLEIFNQVDFA